MQIDEPGPSKATDRRIPHLVVMPDRVIIQEHHHSSINRYMWESSDITNHYSKVTAINVPTLGEGGDFYHKCCCVERMLNLAVIVERSTALPLLPNVC